jgi:hypothetical protein
MGDIVRLDDMRPHFSVHDPVSNQVHVVPTRLVAQIIDGEIALSDVNESMVRALLRHLLEVIAE